jgi:CRP/FNR family transcriptional regulator
MLTAMHNTSAGSGQLPVAAFACHHHSAAPYGLEEVDNSVSATLRANDSNLNDASLAQLDQISHTALYPEGALIFVEGQAPRGVYVLLQGRVKLTTSSRDGKTLILKIVQPGEFLGLHSMVTGKAYETTAETLQPSQFAFVRGADFLRLIRDYPDACLNVAQQLSNECQAAYEGVRSLGLSHSVSEKLARLMLQWCDDGRISGGAIRVKISLTHEEIAQLIGTSRESVTRTLGELKRQHIVELSGSTLTVRNKAALEGLVMD